MAKSRYIYSSDDGGDERAAEISDACAAFEDYLGENDYELAVEVCPHDSEDGYFGAVDAADVALTFLGEHPEWESSCDEIHAHACEIGEVSNAFSGEPEDDLDDDDIDDEPPPLD